MGVPKIYVVQHTGPNIVTKPVDFQMPLEVVASAHFLGKSSAGTAVILLQYLQSQFCRGGRGGGDKVLLVT